MNAVTTLDTGNYERIIRRVWEDSDFAADLSNDPHEAIARETGLSIPRSLSVRVHSEDENTLHLVIPPAPAGLTSSPPSEQFDGIDTTPDGSACVTLSCHCTK